jgi:hypothetical protein
MDPIELVKDYGWMAIIVAWTLPRVWSFLTERLYPERIKARTEAERADRESKATLLKAQIERENRESEARLKLEERQVTVLERMETAISNNNGLITALHSAFMQHERFTYNSTLDLKESIEKLHDIEGLRRDHAKMKEQIRVITDPKIEAVKGDKK